MTELQLKRRFVMNVNACYVEALSLRMSTSSVP